MLTYRHAAIWDVVNGELHLQLEHHDATVLTGILSDEEKYVVTVDSGGILRMWNIPADKTEDPLSPSFQMEIQVLI